MTEQVVNFIGSFIPVSTATLPVFGEVDLEKLAVAGILFFGITALCWFVRLIVLVRLEALSKRTSSTFDDTFVSAIKSIHPWVYSLVAFYAALSLYTLPSGWDQAVRGILYFAFVWQGIQVANCFVRYIITQYVEKDEDGDGVVDPAAATMSDLLTLVASLVLWTLGILFVLSNIGIEVTSLIAGLGIGGIAVAFALQGVLSDLFASFSIYFDKPFRVGDFVVIGTDSGTVEKIGIKSTRIRTLLGEELVVSNAELTTARVQNFKKMDERRGVVEFGITYETPQEKVHKVNSVVEEIFADIAGVRLDRVHFKSFGDSALIFEVVFHVEKSDYVEFMDKQQQFNFALMERFADMGVEFAYPTQTIFHKSIA